MTLRSFACLLLLGLAAPPAPALESYVVGEVDVCPARPDDSGPPVRFEGEGCERQPLYAVDPQGRALWLRVALPPLDTAKSGFLGLLVAGKVASEVYLDGREVGHNGRPALDASGEQPGRMDVVIPLDPRALQAADSVVVLRVSSHHGWLRLLNPIHAIALVDQPDPQALTLRYYLPTLLPLGVFLLAAFYFSSLTLRSERKAVPGLLTGLAVLAGVQLILEVSRGVFSYAYPMHDLRLLGILACSTGFSLCLVAVLTRLYAPQWLAATLLGTAAAATALVAWEPSMDLRTAGVLLIGCAAALLLALQGLRRARPGAAIHAGALLLFGLSLLADPSAFIDHGFYLLVALLMMVLMVVQARAYSLERQRQVEQRLRADRLERALALQQAERLPKTLSVPGTGRRRQIEVDRIRRIQGAGDYVELHLDEGRPVLHSATLNELDAELPPSFLRVHRSHIVNTRFIERLERSEGGTGTLYLIGGDSVPVSRRVMPGVRRALR